MKKGLIFFAGFVVGVILTFVICAIVAGSYSSDSEGKPASTAYDGLTMFEERGDAMPETSFKIFQTIDDTHALANGISNAEYGWYNGITVMIVGEGTHFYDDLIVKKVPGKKFYQVGTFKYQTRIEMDKTVPVVTLLGD